jgi:D-alanine transaminase
LSPQGEIITVPEIAYINGKFLPLEQAAVPIEDRGYQFADAVYEVIRTYRGCVFALDEHLARLFRSLDAIQLQHHHTAAELKALINDIIRRAAFPEMMVYLQISRGVAKRHRGFPDTYEPVFVMTARALPDSRHLRENGITVVTVPDIRWSRCDIKSVGLLANVLAYQTAKQSGVHDALFADADGTVNEATAANIFIIARGQLLTPPEGPKILSGITRNKLLEAARIAGIATAERRVTKTDLYSADEAFLCSTTAEVVPILAADGHKIGDGKPGVISRRVYEQFVRSFTGG